MNEFSSDKQRQINNSMFEIFGWFKYIVEFLPESRVQGLLVNYSQLSDLVENSSIFKMLYANSTVQIAFFLFMNKNAINRRKLLEDRCINVIPFIDSPDLEKFKKEIHDIQQKYGEIIGIINGCFRNQQIELGTTYSTCIREDSDFGVMTDLIWFMEEVLKDHSPLSTES